MMILSKSKKRREEEKKRKKVCVGERKCVWEKEREREY